MKQEQNKQKNKSILSVLTLNYSIRNGNPSGIHFSLFATLSDKGFRFKYYPKVIKKLKCMMVIK